MMNLFSKEELESYIEQNMSMGDIAKLKGCGTTSVHRYLKKFGISTRQRAAYLDKCKVCGKELTGTQQQFCSKKCKAKHFGKLTPEGKKKKCHFQTQRGLDRKKMLVDYAGGCCQRCGYNKNFAALTFHHKNIKEKEYNLSTRYTASKSIEDLFKEVDKCELLCHNCHMEVHYPQMNYSTLAQNNFIIN